MNIQKILIVRTCAVGDFVLNLPALIALQQKEPSMRFTFVGNSSTLDLARDFVSVDAVHSIDLQPWARLFYEPLPDLDFDSAVVWMKDGAVADNLRESGIPNVVRGNPFPAFGHAADQLLRILSLPRPPLPDLWKVASNKVFLHTTSGSPQKNWPYFDGLMGRVTGACLLPRNLSLRELAQYLRQCRAFVGNDSGITHLAAYLGCPTVALFGPTDPRMWGPLGRRSRIIWKTRLEDISIDEVLEVIQCNEYLNRS